MNTEIFQDGCWQATSKHPRKTLAPTSSHITAAKQAPVKFSHNTKLKYEIKSLVVHSKHRTYASHHQHPQNGLV